MSDLSTKDALLERMVTATENLATNVPAKFDEYLPLAGGTMTGEITTSAVDFIKRNVNDNHLTILGGTGYGNSASLYLTGGDTSSNGGTFQLKAQNGTTSKAFIGYPDGSLTWGGKVVPVLGISAGHGIQTGTESNISVAGNGTATGTVTFDTAFASAPMVFMEQTGDYGNIYTCVGEITTTGFKWRLASGRASSVTTSINWLAIG